MFIKRTFLCGNNLIVKKTMDGIVNDDYRFTLSINRDLIRKMEIFTYKLLPSLFYPFFF